ncbi:MAG: hypothetical protein ACRCVA_20635 [Phreatobacter sp.]
MSVLGPRQFLAASALVLAGWTALAGGIAAARSGPAMVVALGDPTALMKRIDPDQVRLLRVTGIFLVAAVNDRAGVRDLYESGAYLVLPAREGGCGVIR